MKSQLRKKQTMVEQYYTGLAQAGTAFLSIVSDLNDKTEEVETLEEHLDNIRTIKEKQQNEIIELGWKIDRKDATIKDKKSVIDNLENDIWGFKQRSKTMTEKNIRLESEKYELEAQIKVKNTKNKALQKQADKLNKLKRSWADIVEILSEVGDEDRPVRKRKCIAY